MTVFSIVFIHLDDKRIFLWMEHAKDKGEALIRAQGEFEKMGIDPTKLAVVVIKGLKSWGINIKKEASGEIILKEIDEYEQWKKEGERGGRKKAPHEGSGEAKQEEGHAREAKRKGRGARERAGKKVS